MTETRHPAWQRHLDGIGAELLRLSIACNVARIDALQARGGARGGEGQ